MKLENLIEELERQKPLKWDKRVKSSQIEMHSAGGQEMFQIKGKSDSEIQEILEKLNKKARIRSLQRFFLPKTLDTENIQFLSC